MITNGNIPSQFTKKSAFLFISFLFSFLLLNNSLLAQVIEIPRVGFPYCEPFTGMGPFDNTSFGGEIRDNISGFYDPNGWEAKPNGQSLTLTPEDFWHSGYAIVEIPFSSQFGIRTSFEYFTYGGNGADGISFFMFDADVPFNLGYLGGSLGYAPYVDPVDGHVIAPGISGGYIGIGFDEQGNFGNGTVGEPISNWEGRVGNSVSIRAPESEDYDLWDRQVTVPFSQPWLNQDPPFPPSQYFTIESDVPSRVTDCLMPGYRKVFIELDPVVSGPGYNVKITMLVNTATNGQQKVTFPPVLYPFTAPERLKIGFAGATGFRDNHHEIRNVSVNVFDASQISEPKVEEQLGVICEGDAEVEMEFKVQLSTPDAFITCLQLFNTNPGAPDNTIPPTDFLACGMDGNLCRNKCNPDNYEEQVFDASGKLIGTFYSELQELNTGNFNQIRDVVNVKFVAEPSFVGEALVYYNVTDNYGLTSQPEVIRIVSNPFPSIDGTSAIFEYPTCDGQKDGSIKGIKVDKLVSGFDYEWLWNGASIGKAGATFNQSTQTFEIEGVNLGTYTLNVWNPSNNSNAGCYESYDFKVDQENGTPVELRVDKPIICEGESATFIPTISNIYNPTGASAAFDWYLDENRTGGPLVNGSTISIDGNPVQVFIKSNGELVLQGLKYTGTGTSKSYSFYVEAQDVTVPTGGNFCPFLGVVQAVGTVDVLEPLDFNVDHTEDWCLDGSGTITAAVNNVSGPVTYFLEDGSGNPLSSNSTGIFTGLAKGEYEVYAATTGCNTPLVPVTVDGPDTPLTIQPIAVSNTYCELPNGSLEFSISGGNLPYQSITVNGNLVPFQTSGNYTVSDLSAKTYTIVVLDKEGCSTSITMDIPADPLSQFAVLGSEVCEGKAAKAVIEINMPSSGSPVFNWYYLDNGGNYVLITDGLKVGNVTYQISPSFELSATGLLANPDPYLVYLNVTGDKICDQGYLPAELKVTPGPEMNAPITTVTCFGEANGSIQAQIPGNNFSDFEFSITGDNGYFEDYSKNDGFFDNLPGGIYQLSIKSALGCITTLDGVEVDEPVGPISINTDYSIERASCDLPNGLIKDIQITGGWGSYTVVWRKGTIDGQIVSGDLTGLQDLFPDTYHLIVSDAEGCSASFEFVVGELSDPVYDVVPPIDVCLGEQVEIRPIHLAPDPNLPPAAFTEVYWYKDSGQRGLITSGVDASLPGVTYLVDDTDWLNPRLIVNGLPVGKHDFYFYVECTGQEIKTEIKVFETPNVLIDTSPISCFGEKDGKVIFTSGTSPDYLYSINSAPPISQSDVESLTFVAGTYDLEIITPAGCPQVLEFIVEGPDAALEISTLTGIDPGCGALNGKLEASISGGWSPYTVRVFLNGSVVNTFETADPSVKLDGLVSGTYYLEITDDQNCQVISSELELVDGPSQILVEDQSICEGQQVIFTPSIDPSAPGASFEWYFDSNSSQKINSSSSPNAQGITYEIDSGTGELMISGLVAKNTPYKYYVIAKGNGVCEGYVAEAEAIVYGSPSATYTTIDEVCFEDGGTIDVSASGGSGKYTFILDGQISQNNGLFQNVPKGIHSIRITTPETCEITLDNIEIVGPSSPLEGEIIEIVNPTCELSNGSVTLQLKGGISDYSVSVIKNGINQGRQSSDQNGLVVIDGIGQGEYAFEITDALGCKITLSEPLDLVEVPTEITLADLLICEGQDALLAPKVPTNVVSPVFTWFFDQDMNDPLQSGVVDGVTYAINSKGELTISGLLPNTKPYEYYAMVDGLGVCGVLPKRVQVLVNPFPNLRVSNPSIVCDPTQTVDLTNYIEGYNPSVYDYNIINPLGNALVGNEVKAVNLSGNYQVTSSLKGSGCWTESQRILVRIAEEQINANFLYHADQGGGIVISNEVIQILENVDFEDISTGDVINWEWDFGDGSSSNLQNPRHVYSKKGSFIVTLKTTDSLGCQSVYSILVEVKDDYLLMMPNAFTPEGVKNQYYKPMHRGIASIEFYVFNTWGELIYQTDSLEDLGWDGNHNGKPAPNGNYVYKVKYETRSGNVFDESGVFILIR